MAIRAVIFDLGGVLIEIDWARYRKVVCCTSQTNSMERLLLSLALLCGTVAGNWLRHEPRKENGDDPGLP